MKINTYSNRYILKRLDSDSAIFPIHSLVSVGLHDLVLHQRQLLGHGLAIFLMLQEISAHCVEDNSSQLGFVQCFL